MEILNNPFSILKITPKDKRSVIIESSKNALLDHDADKVIYSRNMLLNSRKRLLAELAWIPQEDLFCYSQIIQQMDDTTDYLLFKNNTNHSQLYLANFLVSHIKPEQTLSRNLYLIELLIHVVEEFDVNRILDQLNIDRLSSGFPELLDISILRLELQERILFYSQTICNIFGCLNNYTLLSSLEKLQSKIYRSYSTEPTLLTKLIDYYECIIMQEIEGKEIEIKKLLAKEKEMIEIHYDVLQITPYFFSNRTKKHLFKIIESWGELIYPIHRSYSIRGLENLQCKTFVQEIDFFCRNLLRLQLKYEAMIVLDFTKKIYPAFQGIPASEVSRLTKLDREVLWIYIIFFWDKAKWSQFLSGLARENAVIKKSLFSKKLSIKSILDLTSLAIKSIAAFLCFVVYVLVKIYLTLLLVYPFGLFFGLFLILKDGLDSLLRVFRRISTLNFR